MEKTLNLISFRKDKNNILLEKFGYSVEEDGTLYDENFKGVTCESCFKKMTTKSFGMIMPGSKKILCKSSACFLKYLAEKEEKEENKSKCPD